MVSVWRPGPNVSIALPSRKNTASWFSCTISWAPSLMSVEPSGGTRCTIERFDVVEKLDDFQANCHVWGS